MSEQSNPQSDADISDLDPNALAAIRDLIASDDVAPSEPEAAPLDGAAAPERKSARFSPLPPPSHPDAAPKVKVKKQKKLKPRKPQGEGMFDLLKAKVMGYRPTPKHILWASAILLVLFRPWLVLGLFFLFAFILTGIFLILGYDGFWHSVMRVARWYARKHPSRSKELHRKLDDFAVRFDAFLDRFPEGSVDGLYLPDFGDLAEAQARHDEALERRLDSLRENEA